MNKNMKDLAPIALPHGPPVECTAEYFKSLMESASMVQPTPSVLMEQVRRDLMDADEKLALKRAEGDRNRALMDTKWAELRNKEMLLKESFISFNKFIRENQEKRDRADRKMEADQEVLERKTRETEAMRQRVGEMQEVKEMMEKQVRDYTIYEERDLEMLENARQEIAALTEEKKLFMMGLNNTLADLRWRYDQVRSRVIKWELALNRLKETAAKRHVEICHVRSAIWSLYVKICRSKGLLIDLPVDDFEQQLVVIMRALLELRRIYKIAERKSKEKRLF
ncbi:putative coiled-coil domain-containing protein [Operophtera brumata]|uniref:Putative coiled-coil domain-containing protein n=1 Tax=Operophtera brumata TaxID=104452 RepID=A0A0L7KP72_OPEBR|nr:putative coiled-coil domain-containing protein [Operophtera brumata]